MESLPCSKPHATPGVPIQFQLQHPYIHIVQMILLTWRKPRYPFLWGHPGPMAFGELHQCYQKFRKDATWKTFNAVIGVTRRAEEVQNFLCCINGTGGRIHAWWHLCSAWRKVQLYVPSNHHISQNESCARCCEVSAPISIHGDVDMLVMEKKLQGLITLGYIGEFSELTSKLIWIGQEFYYRCGEWAPKIRYCNEVHHKGSNATSLVLTGLMVEPTWLRNLNDFQGADSIKDAGDELPS